MTRLIELDDELVTAIEQDSKAVSAQAAVKDVLRDHLALRRKITLRELRGSVEFWPDYDYKAMRQAD